ncbi:hypothetical protein NA56DRAFT_643117 [Hyaloscypha hepaticicola]|uniref:Lytic polysaccharide monooxygenase n=1 Tax=Hyaloscypha hepaticicola TaxID=2082293 RepID=A0A2J6QE71_9HELO|nr:hypothetical protein NA56DRAFT_643117 [Hyaloscypha hepaticicola]
MKYQTILSTMLMIPMLASAHIVPRASSSSSLFCFTETGTRGNGVVCGPFAYGVSTLFDGTGSSSTGNTAVATSTSSTTTVPSASGCTTVTMTVTVTQPHRAGNGTWPYLPTGSFSRHHGGTGGRHHLHGSASALTLTPDTTIASIPHISLTGNPSPPPSASSLSAQPSFLPPTLSAAGSPGGPSASSSI